MNAESFKLSQVMLLCCRSVWDITMLIVMCVTLCVTPVEIAFYQHEMWNLNWINLTIDSYFILDMILNFRTAYIHNITDQVELHLRY